MTIRFDLKWAQTLDGQLCDDSDTSQWISGSEEREQTHQLRSHYDGILVGANTFIEDLCRLTIRSKNYKGEQPLRIILDPRGKVEKTLTSLGPQSKIAKEINNNNLRKTIIISPQSTLLNLIASDQHNRLCHLEFKGDFEDQYFLKKISSLLSAKFPDIQQVLVEGGARLLSEFFKKNFYDKAIVSISSQITGGSKHRLQTKRILENSFNHTIEKIQQFESDIIMYLRPLVPRRAKA